MNRRTFFKRTAGAVTMAAVAPHLAVETQPQLTHREYGMGWDVSETELRRMARLLGESARRRQEQYIVSVFNNGFTEL